MTPGELAGPENGIWLCATHARIIDSNLGAGYPPETLLIYKDIQEAWVRQEAQGLYTPIGWIHEVHVRANPFFAAGQTVRLAKLNLVLGPNDSGKTALTEWIVGCFDIGQLDRWRKSYSGLIHVKLTYLNPKPIAVELRIESDRSVRYRVDNVDVPFNPVAVRVIRIERLYFGDADDRSALSNILGLHPSAVENLIDEVNNFPHARVHNARFVNECGRVWLYVDMEGTVPGLSLGSLGMRETECVVVEFATAAARVSGRYTPTLLVLDGCPVIYTEEAFDFYSHYVLDPENRFQTIMCLPDRGFDLDALRWKGWTAIRTEGCAPSIVLSQELRPATSSSPL